jgi:hypothetical protein
VLAVPAVLTIALTATACGSDNTEALNTWAKKVCDPAKREIGSAQTALADTGRVQQGEKPGDLQARLSGDLGTLANASNGLADAIEEAGPPKTDEGAGGEKIQKDAVRELRKSASGYSGVKKDVEGLDIDDQDKFAKGLRTAGTRVQKLAGNSASAMKKLQKGELGKAIARQPGCKRATPAASSSPSEAVSKSPSAAPSKSGSPKKSSARPKH